MLVGLYPRVSTSEQAQHGYSIGEQIERMQKYCDAMGWTVYDIYTDLGFSGGTMERPGLQRMIRDVEKKRIEKVVVYKLDRLSRSQKDTLRLIEDTFLANGVDFVSISENFDTAKPLGKAMIGILAVFAQLEREQIKERMAMGRDARTKKGEYIGGTCPIGYDRKDKKLIVNEFEALQIKQLFERCAQGIPIRIICNELNESGMTHKYGTWHQESARHILRQRTYLGEMTVKGIWHKGIHEPIISTDLFNKCQIILERRTQRHKFNQRNGVLNSYLGGLLFCGQCGTKYYRRTKVANGHRYMYYECYSRTVHNAVCRNKIWSMDKLDQIIFGEIKKLAIDPEYISQLSSPRDEDDRIEVIDRQTKSIDLQISKLMDLYSTSGIPIELLQQKVSQLNEKRLQLESEADRIKKESADRLSREEIVGIVSSFDDILSKGDFFEIREVIETLIERIDLDGDDITIHWTFG